MGINGRMTSLLPVFCQCKNQCLDIPTRGTHFTRELGTGIPKTRGNTGSRNRIPAKTCTSGLGTTSTYCKPRLVRASCCSRQTCTCPTRPGHTARCKLDRSVPAYRDSSRGIWTRNEYHKATEIRLRLTHS